MTTGVHSEARFEDQIVDALVAQGYQIDLSRDFDKQRALFPAQVLAFVQATQPAPWAKLRAMLKERLEELFLQELCKVMDQRGALEVLRRGLEFYGRRLRVAFFKPGHQKNPAQAERCAHNRLSVARQLAYDQTDNRLDLALCLNGIPLVTCELKNAMTSQRAGHARRQYRQTRDPKAPLFVFKARALVHFAVDADEAWMTTRLEGEKTSFLPFNRGHNRGAGNPPSPGKHRTCYLWEEIWAPDSLLDLVARFIHLDTQSGTDPNTGKRWSKEALIFPRYHQLDCVRRLEAAARRHGAGSNYLVQHSAGSGKSNSIAWLAHRLASLHDDDDQKVYHSVIVLTDRLVLDQQLQATISQFDHEAGVIEVIDKRAEQLAAALQSGAPIIVSTIHKFAFIQDKLRELPDRRYAIIVDEAHSSQSGELATTVKELLADSSLGERLSEEALEEELSTLDQAALRRALARGPQPNLSFFAFTATPKFKTLELFGHKDADGRPAPFHLYSMRQAIEEGFILDVLQGYTTYERFFQLAKAIEDDPQLDKKRAAAALARFVNLHPTNIAQKTEIIIEHFRGAVAHQLGGKAKAMVVTASRLQAVKYKLSFDGYTQKMGYRDIQCLVAFSGEVPDDLAPGVSWTEPGMNGGIREAELPQRFASDQYQVLLVANKYQTGFDQPLLCAMYVDKRLSGIQAVQTLSRLNRTSPGKERTFVLDFVNDRQEILDAFQDYYEATSTAAELDPQRLYTLRRELLDAQLFTLSEVDAFAAVFFQLPEHATAAAHGRLNAWLDPAVDRFQALAPLDDPERARLQESFRGRLSAFERLYGFLSQIIPFQDPALEKLYAFARMLLRKLPQPPGAAPLELGQDVTLLSLKLKLQAEGALTLRPAASGELRGPSQTGTGAATPARERLSTIIDALNQRFGLELPAHLQDFLSGVSDALASNHEVQLSARANDKANFAHVFQPALLQAMAEHMSDSMEFVNLFFDDPRLRDFLVQRMLAEVYDRLRAHEPSPAPPRVPSLARLPLPEVKPFVNAVPIYDLQVAAGRFSDPQAVQEVPQHQEVANPSAFEWVKLEGAQRPQPGLFVARVVGESMNRTIPPGAWCLWRLHPPGSREGKIVLAQHRDLSDGDLGRYTVKRYRAQKRQEPDGSWRHVQVTLLPESTDPAYAPLVFGEDAEGHLQIIAELLEILA
jgi:type I restriction enzyme R subunit